MDDNIHPVEFGIRTLGLLSLWFVLNPVRSMIFFIGLANAVIILAVVARYGAMIRHHMTLTIELATWMALAFWLPQTQLTTTAIIMAVIMFTLMSLFATFYRSSERVAAIERQRLERQVNLDTLTSARSLFAFKTEAAQAFETAHDEHTSLCLVMFDLDHFKSINDTYGHITGNTVLITVVRAVQGVVQQFPELNGHLYRTGGEEFNLVFPASSADVRPVVQQIHQQIQNTPIIDKGHTLKVAASMGVAELTAGDASLEELYARADHNLYQSKRQGRNQITFDHQSA